MFQQNRRAITEFVKQAYLAYFGVKLVIRTKRGPRISYVKLAQSNYGSGLPAKENV
nr:unnamed protein product [Callosobruchus analis]